MSQLVNGGCPFWASPNTSPGAWFCVVNYTFPSIAEAPCIFDIDLAPDWRSSVEAYISFSFLFYGLILFYANFAIRHIRLMYMGILPHTRKTIANHFPLAIAIFAMIMHALEGTSCLDMWGFTGRVFPDPRTYLNVYSLGFGGGQALSMYACVWCFNECYWNTKTKYLLSKSICIPVWVTVGFISLYAIVVYPSVGGALGKELVSDQSTTLGEKVDIMTFVMRAAVVLAVKICIPFSVFGYQKRINKSMSHEMTCKWTTQRNRLVRFGLIEFLISAAYIGVGCFLQYWIKEQSITATTNILTMERITNVLTSVNVLVLMDGNYDELPLQEICCLVFYRDTKRMPLVWQKHVKVGGKKSNGTSVTESISSDGRSRSSNARSSKSSSRGRQSTNEVDLESQADSKT
jgi:hypothetical protein